MESSNSRLAGVAGLLFREYSHVPVCAIYSVVVGWVLFLYFPKQMLQHIVLRIVLPQVVFRDIGNYSIERCWRCGRWRGFAGRNISCDVSRAAESRKSAGEVADSELERTAHCSPAHLRCPPGRTLQIDEISDLGGFRIEHAEAWFTIGRRIRVPSGARGGGGCRV